MRKLSESVDIHHFKRAYPRFPGPVILAAALTARETMLPVGIVAFYTAIISLAGILKNHVTVSAHTQID